uniref:Reverse transcriptase domain-containing protein n=1 Tax=Podarcis muralis TaxID=64176 RepID=A0A670IGN9_PODMU
SELEQEVIEKAKTTLKDYFDLKINKETHMDIVWDASKAVLRGFLIQQNSYRKKVREQKKEELITQLRECEKNLIEKPNDERNKQLYKMLQTQYSILINQETGIKATKKVKYLGIWITMKNINLMEDNYTNTWKEIRKDLDTWNRIKLSWSGRMAAIKMSLLPKLLFLFQNIPIIRGTSVFNDWQKVLSKFIWQGKRPRIRFKLLTDQRDRGGFAVPNLKLYYEASCLCWVKEWIVIKNTDQLDLEGFNIRFGWHAYLWRNKEKVHKGFSNHIIRGPLLEVWERNKKLLERNTPWWLSPIDNLTIKK